jgi:hypothetical protein
MSPAAIRHCSVCKRPMTDYAWQENHCCRYCQRFPEYQISVIVRPFKAERKSAGQLQQARIKGPSECAVRRTVLEFAYVQGLCVSEFVSVTRTEG